MAVFTNNEFCGHWPVGTAAVVVADNHEHAATLLEESLAKIGLSQKIKPEEMIEIPLVIGEVRILNDGNY